MGSAEAQETPEGAYVKLGGHGAPALEGPPLVARSLADVELVLNGLPNVLLTGYWPPTNEMLRPFSTDGFQNPDGWVGENWEGRGYNVYAFFPEFPGGTPVTPEGEGDFMVDYQDTSPDFWLAVETLRPIAIVAYGRAGYDWDWELEGGNRMYSLSTWSNDYVYPYDPTPELPIADEVAGTERMSSLPMQAIVDAVEAAVPALAPYSTAIDTSRFLCNYMGYHVNWYQDVHDDPYDPHRCYLAGFIHLGSRMTVDEAMLGNEATLRATLEALDGVRRWPGDMDDDADVDGADFAAFSGCMHGPGVVLEAGCVPANIDRDWDADVVDFWVMQRSFGGGTP